MHRTSKYGIRADLGRSHGPYLYDDATGRHILDLFGMYSSLPLGYNHPVFLDPGFVAELAAHAGVKITTCEVATASTAAFEEAFCDHPAMSPFAFFHFASTGALAIEAALKIAWRANGPGLVAVFRSSFHGINGYGGLVAPNGPAAGRLVGFGLPDLGWCLDDPTPENADALLGDIRRHARRLAAVLVEPIQCTAGDRVVDVGFLRRLRALCTELSLPLIFDEVQTGFYGTGTMWYFERLGLVPDIVVFGKKAQVSGVMARETMRHAFRDPCCLEVTWDGDVLDMIRCRAILRAYTDLDIGANVAARGAQFSDGVPGLRRVGLLMAMDFMTTIQRDAFVRELWRQRVMVIPTGAQAVRLRPPLSISAEDVAVAVGRIGSAR